MVERSKKEIERRASASMEPSEKPPVFYVPKKIFGVIQVAGYVDEKSVIHPIQEGPK